MNDPQLTNLFLTGKEKEADMSSLRAMVPQQLLNIISHIEICQIFSFIWFHLLKTHAKFFEVLIFLTN